jgi:hypothetical protein
MFELIERLSLSKVPGQYNARRVYLKEKDGPPNPCSIRGQRGANNKFDSNARSRPAAPARGLGPAPSARRNMQVGLMQVDLPCLG